ncbi:MAG TPA: DNA polymerase III subunit epsilon [Gammaproteobacteria bacterium]|nr:DNA polymerase III subunit epsilon [Gammaproteobacteria bacterium]
MRQISISIEATGAEPSLGHKVIEIGCVELINRKLTGKHLHYYINPHREIEDSVVERTGISNEFLYDKPEFIQIKDQIINFIKGSELLAYNAPFVVGFLNNELAFVDSKIQHIETICKVIDVQAMARTMFPKSSNSLSEVAKRVFVDDSQKNLSGTLFDSEIIADVYLALTSESLRKVLSLHSQKEGIYINSFPEFIEATDGFSRSALCRGVSNKDYLLLPSLFRNSSNNNPDAMEHNLMWVFKTHAKALLPRLPSSEIEWLTVAQHHGLPTRLLDWSLSPLVACFFAINSSSRSDACVYIYDVGKFKKEEDIQLKALSSIVAFFPSHATKRITAQSGMFTVHPTNNRTLDPPEIRKIIIPAKLKSEFREKLSKFGIHYGTLFPDLDGLSNHIRYLNGFDALPSREL